MTDPAGRRVSMTASKRKSGKLGGKGKGKGGRYDEEENDKENAFAYKVLSEAQTKSLLELDADDVQKELVSIMRFPKHETDLLEASQLDYYTGAFWWAKEQGYNVTKISALYTAAHTLLLNVKEKHMHILDNLQEFREMMAGIGIECESPGGLDCFDTAQAAVISDFFHNSLFQHYKLYQFVFSHTQAEEIIGLDLTCELVKPADIPYPPPLAEGLPYQVWEKYVKTPPPTPIPATQHSNKSDEHEQSEVDARQAAADLASKQEARAQKEADLAREAEVLSKLTAEEIKQVVEITTRDTFKNLNAEMAAKLRERENTIVGRINKIHKVATG